MLRSRAGRLACPLFLLCLAAQAQDERTVHSPDGQVEFQIWSAPQQDISLFRLAYRVSFGGKPIIETSFLGLNILDQEPILGENAGLISAVPQNNAKYNGLLAKYVQNGSTGRSIDIEIRVYNDGVAFRYIVPKSALLENIDINAELTEFRLPGLHAIGRIPVPFTTGRIAITETRDGEWPPLYLKPLNEATLITDTHFAGVTPLTCPWRIIAIKSGSPGDRRSEVIADLNGAVKQ